MKKWVSVVIILLIVLYVAAASTESDYDKDGMPDAWEKRNSLRFDINDAKLDPDKDGIKNIDEYLQGTNPHLADAKIVLQGQEKSAPAVKTTKSNRYLFLIAATFVFAI